MKVAISAFVLLMAALIFGCDRASIESRPDSPHKPVMLQEGEYLSTAYIDELKKTRSPLIAGKAGRIDLIIVSRDEHNALRFSQIVNFHEGGATFVLHSNGLVAFLPASSGTEKPSLKLVDDRSFQFGYASSRPATYVLVNKATDYVSKLVLVGNYRDRRGLIYEFRDDGWATFPERRFRFEIGMDHVLNDYDYFMDSDRDGKAWAFRWHDDTMQVFATREDSSGVEEIVGNRPQLLLHRVR